MATVATIELQPGPLADPSSSAYGRLVGDLDRLARDGPRSLLLMCRGGVGADEPRPLTPPGVTDPAALLASFPAPTIAAWDGGAVGAGAELMLAADLRVVGADATFAFPEVPAGTLPSWGGTQRLPRAGGVALALRLLLTGEAASADELARRGVAVCVADPFEHARALAERLGRGAPRAQQSVRDAVLRGLDVTLADGLRLEADLNLLLSTTRDRAEGIDAFFAKREPRFTGE